MPSFLKLLALSLLVTSCGESPRDERPDVLLISLDSVRADFLDFADPESAPNLCELAKRGTVFTQAISGTSWTLPAHAQMFTGMPPALHCLQSGDLRLDPEIPVMPELLAEAGYQTAGFYTCWYLAAEYGFGRGFQHYGNSMQGGAYMAQALSDAVAAEGDMDARRLAFRRWTGAESSVTSPTVVENATEVLESMDGDEPAFLFAHFFDPHFDYVPPPPYNEQFDPGYQGTMRGVNFWENPDVYDANQSPARQISERDLDHIRALYRGEIAWTDAAIGKLLAALEKRGKLENTLIIVTADHGEEFFEHDNRGHRQSLFDEVIRVPLLIVPPGKLGNRHARHRDEQVSLSDLLPTVLDYAGVQARSSWHGRSLRPAVENGAATSRPLVSNLVMPLLDGGTRSGRSMWDALRTPEEKLIRFWTQMDDAAEPTLRTLYYYDLVADPAELQPIRTMQDPRVRRAWKDLERELDVIRLEHREAERTPPAQLTTEVYSIVSDDLAHLGYAGMESERGTVDPAVRLGAAPLPPSRLSGGGR
jgi:arylsulfatase A-like enzyme